jgi:hypothetical protein
MSNASSIAAGRLYRILDFHRVVQIFETESLYFSHPRVWDDPYEQHVIHAQSHAIFAQCWCRIGVSDAMWRIYSPNFMGVRIGTSTKTLSRAIKMAIKDSGFQWRGDEVAYLSQFDLHQKVARTTQELENNFDVDMAVGLLYAKREAFEHENEWRATVFCPKEDPGNPKDGIALKVNPHAVIDSILLDPRAPKELVDAFKFYFKSKLNFRKKVEASVLYKKPKQIVLGK